MAKASNGQNTVRTVENLVRPVVEEMGLRLWDVRFEEEGPDWFLRILIDRDEPLDMDTCEKASRAIDPVIDAADPISQSYYMEVGSPGLGRRLTRPEHFEGFIGKEVEIHLVRADEAGLRDYAGVLTAFEEGKLTLNCPQGEKSFELCAASYVKACDDKDLF